MSTSSQINSSLRHTSTVYLLALLVSGSRPSPHTPTRTYSFTSVPARRRTCVRAVPCEHRSTSLSCRRASLEYCPSRLTLSCRAAWQVGRDQLPRKHSSLRQNWHQLEQPSVATIATTAPWQNGLHAHTRGKGALQLHRQRAAFCPAKYAVRPSCLEGVLDGSKNAARRRPDLSRWGQTAPTAPVRLFRRTTRPVRALGTTIVVEAYLLRTTSRLFRGARERRHGRSRAQHRCITLHLDQSVEQPTSHTT